MELFFNEVSLYPFGDNKSEVDKVYEIRNLITDFRKNGFSNLRSVTYEQIKLSEKLNLKEWTDLTNNNEELKKYRDLAYFIYSNIRPPYLNKNDEKVSVENYRLKDPNSKELNDIIPYGLAFADKFSSFSIGIPSSISPDDFLWKISDNEGKEKQVLCIHSSSKMNEDKVIDILVQLPDLNVPECKLKPSDKNIKKKMPDHHESKEVEKFGKDLLEDPYIVEVINSIDQNSCEKNFIRKIFDDGKIEIRMTWTKRGSGLIVSTTGKNLYQTAWIAHHLEKHFKHK